MENVIGGDNVSKSTSTREFEIPQTQADGINSSGNIDRYPEKPIKPSDSDCCGSGCSTCVFDLYDLDVKRWQKRCEEIDQGFESSSSKAATISIYEYTPFEIINIVDLSVNVKLFTFRIPDNGRLPIQSGQHLVARCVTSNGRTVIRPYTPVSKVTQRGSFVVAVKLYESGQMSECIRYFWKMNSFVEWRGPFGDFRYQANTCSDLILIAGGTGITPILQIIQEIMENEEDYTKVNLLYSVHSVDDFIMKEELDSWNSFWNFNVNYFITDKDITDFDAYRKKRMKYGDKVHFERISEDSFMKLTEKIQNKGNIILICGTRSFNQDMNILVRKIMNVEDNDIVIFE